MCGIFAICGLAWDSNSCEREWRKKVVKLSKRQRHRGPDWESIYSDGRGNILAHQRLAIVGVGEQGDQPFVRPGISWIANGEIYNHEKLTSQFFLERETTSDSEIVGLLYKKFGTACIPMMDGFFAFVVVDEEQGTIFAARDHMGLASMYVAYGKDGSVWFSSELKPFVGVEEIERYELFPPGHMYTGGPGGKGMERWYSPKWLDEANYVPTNPVNYDLIRKTTIDAVVKRLMTDVPFGVLLSGGLDSSLVSAIAVRHLHDNTSHLEWSEKIHSFSIGIEGAPDLIAAKKVADHLGTVHHEFHFTPQEALDALPDVVYHLESYEQVRASVPMFLLSRKIKALGVKMVLSGEGADETLGGYLYFHKAPSPQEFHKECVRKTTRLHQWDVMRANKTTMAWGVEARSPFMDKEWLEVVMNIRPEDKMIDMKDCPDGVHPRMEKYLLRKAFDTPENPYLPESVLWRQKEQFSDGVGYDWVDSLKEYAEVEISDADFAARVTRFPFNPPETKEYYMLRTLFDEFFPDKSALDSVPTGKSIACSTPEAVAWDPMWMKSTGDISGRAIDVHTFSGDFIVGESTMDQISFDEEPDEEEAHKSMKEELASSLAQLSQNNGPNSATAGAPMVSDMPLLRRSQAPPLRGWWGKARHDRTSHLHMSLSTKSTSSKSANARACRLSFRANVCATIF